MSGQMVGSLNVEALGQLLDAQLDYYGKRMAASSSDHTVHVVDITDGQQKPAGQLRGHEAPVWKVSWAHPKFGSLLATCSYDMKVMIWKEVPPYSTSWQIAHMDSSHSASVNDVQFCPWEHGLRLACASSDGTVSVLTHGPDQQWRRTAFPAHPGGAQAVSWMPVQENQVMRLATGGCDNSVHIWKCDGEAWSLEQPPLPAVHSDWVRAVAWRPSPGAAVVASGGWDKTVVIFSQEMEGQAWRQLCKIEVAGKVEGLSWSVTGSVLAVSFGDGDASLYRETMDGRYEEIGKVGEAGFTEVASSFTAAPAAPAAPATASADIGMGTNAATPQTSTLSDELAAQQKSVMDAFAGF